MNGFTTFEDIGYPKPCHTDFFQKVCEVAITGLTKLIVDSRHLICGYTLFHRPFFPAIKSAFTGYEKGKQFSMMLAANANNAMFDGSERDKQSEGEVDMSTMFNITPNSPS